MRPGLIAFDLDGTLLTSDKRLSEANREAIIHPAPATPATGKGVRRRVRPECLKRVGDGGKPCARHDLRITTQGYAEPTQRVGEEVVRQRHR